MLRWQIYCTGIDKMIFISTAGCLPIRIEISWSYVEKRARATVSFFFVLLLAPVPVPPVMLVFNGRLVALKHKDRLPDIEVSSIKAVRILNTEGEFRAFYKS
jgi:hypothetical protein